MQLLYVVGGLAIIGSLSAIGWAALALAGRVDHEEAALMAQRFAVEDLATRAS